MKTNRILVGLAGVLVFLSIALTFIWVLPSRNSTDAKELTYDEAISKIKNRDISEVFIKEDTLEITNKNREKFFTKINANDYTRRNLLIAIDSINADKPKA